MPCASSRKLPMAYTRCFGPRLDKVTLNKNHVILAFRAVIGVEIHVSLSCSLLIRKALAANRMIHWFIANNVNT